jgi:hypothetical protein
VGVGPALVGAVADGESLANIWLYIVGPVLGGMAAVPVYRLQNSASD